MKLRRRSFFAIIFGSLMAFLLLPFNKNSFEDSVKKIEGERISLPPPRLKGDVSLEEAIFLRRSKREYLNKPIKLEDLSQLLWAAQGITEPALWVGLRSSPSAGGLYPLEIYVAVREGGVIGLKAGVYHYDPYTHTIIKRVEGDVSKDLRIACVDQEWVEKANVNIIFTAVIERSSKKYGSRAWQYIFQESGHSAQNVYLQATVLGLGGTVIGAFIEEEIQRILSTNELPVYVMPIGPIK
ncbi:hypothetical protein HRbin06_00237 [archaeon HR06]|nr:hypothetical protein HRbin06_00237 [archaeon HR06]